MGALPLSAGEIVLFETKPVKKLGDHVRLLFDQGRHASVVFGRARFGVEIGDDEEAPIVVRNAQRVSFVGIDDEAGDVGREVRVAMLGVNHDGLVAARHGLQHRVRVGVRRSHFVDANQMLLGIRIERRRQD
jgi:hypothetical protein